MTLLALTTLEATSVSIRCNYPILPLEILEAHVEGLDLTAFRIVIWMDQRIPVLIGFRLLLSLLLRLSLGAIVMMPDVFLWLDHLERSI